VSYGDPKKPKRLRDTDLFRRLHIQRGECAICLTGYGLQLHHKIRRSQGGGDIPENLVWLCYECHTRLHAGNLTVHEVLILEAASVLDFQL
jgi:5-methylcytosine-specific restriction endonuclease McrA